MVQTLRGRCECSHVFVIAHLPMPVHLVAELAKAARCPKCASSKIFPATDDPNEKVDLPRTMNRGDRLVIDDPCAESPTEVAETIRKFREVDQNRADGGANIVTTHTNIAGTP